MPIGGHRLIDNPVSNLLCWRLQGPCLLIYCLDVMPE
jgi:hypothetical protein